MGLAIKFLLTILIELPIVALFFHRKKRKSALLRTLLVNGVSWPVAYVLIFSVDINIIYIVVIVIIGEAIAFNKLLGCNWIKAVIMSMIVNSLSFYFTQFVPVNLDLFPAKQQLKEVSYKNP